MRIRVLLGLLALTIIASSRETTAADPLKGSLLFHAGFDSQLDADLARGDAKIYTAKSLKREDVSAGLKSSGAEWKREGGRYGGCLQFTKKTNEIVFFKGPGNLPKTSDEMEGTICFWMRVAPNSDLPPGYVDPLQITDKKWNDASFFVDFTKDVPREFRLGVFSDYSFWNPKDRKWDDIPDEERPLVTVKKPPFTRDAWTHVAIAFANFNDKDPGKATLYLDGKRQGAIDRPQRFTWGDKRLAIMLGIYYVGGLDDLAVFDRVLTASEIQKVISAPKGVASLRR